MNIILKSITNTLIKMKKIIAFVMLMFTILAIGQTTTENYVKTTTYQIPTQTDVVDDEQKIENITYYDGLGRVMQSVSAKAGGNKQNVVQMVTYDSLGRTSKQYLPYATPTEMGTPLNFTNQGVLKDSIETFYNTFKYENTQNPYSETLFEESPLSRPLRQGAPGNSWVIQKDTIFDHTIHYIYTANTTSNQDDEGDDVLDFNVVFNGTDITQPSLQLIGIHSENRLSKTIVQDENFEQRYEAVGPPPGPFDPPQEYTIVESGDHAIEEFTNKKGQVVLKRTYDQEVPHDTYYVYDDFGNLTFVLSPEGSSQIVNGSNLVSNYQDILDRLCYQYRYDYRNRLIEKKIPAKGWEYIYYDLLDRPVLTQDARLRENNQYLFTKYDALNRVVYTGIYQATGGGSNTLIQTAINAQTSFNETRTAATSIGNDTIYYSNGVFPSSNITIHTVNYYDSYIDHAGITLPPTVYADSLTNSTRGLPTVSKVRVLENSDWITSVTGYDEKARPVYGVSVNAYLDTEDITESRLDFIGKVLESKTTHQKTRHQAIVTKDYFTYDHQNRLVTHTQQIDNEPVQLIASNSYDEIGQLESKRVGGQLFEIGYTDLVNVVVSNDGYFITKTDDANSYNAGLATIGKLEDNGGFSFTIETIGSELRVGLNNINTDPGAGGMNYYYLFTTNYNSNGYLYYVFTRPLAGGGSTLQYSGRYLSDNKNFSIEIEEGVAHFKQNGNIKVSVPLEDSEIPLIGDISLKTPNSQISNLNFYATTIDKSLQKVDYAYNVRGWLTDINPETNQNEADLFTFKLYYDDTEGFDTSQDITPTPLYNGNIVQTIWSTANTDKQERSYAYTYDALNRISIASSGKGVAFNTKDVYSLYDVSYDKNGNIGTLKRDSQASKSSTALMDDLTYTYIGNQLQKVDDASGNTNGFKDGGQFANDYTYDVNGNLTTDQNKKITNITYNHLNLPTSIIINDAGGENGTITYIYDATGIKLAKVLVDNSQGITKTTSYAGGYIYERVGSVETLQLFSHPEGYIEPIITSGSTAYQYAFNYTDHLGNIRLTYADSNLDGSIESKSEIISEKHYYPFGLQQKGYNDAVTSNVNSVAERFMFGGKEYGQELGLDWYDISARNYDPALGRWMNIDPLSEKFHSWSLYNYVYNNPNMFIDPTGMGPWPPSWLAKAKSIAIGVAHGFIGHDPKKPPADQGYMLDTFRQHSNTERVKSDDDYYEGGRIGGAVLYEVVETYVTGGLNNLKQVKGAGEIVEQIIKEGGEELSQKGVKEGAEQLGKKAVSPNRLNHVFGKAEHNLDDFVKSFGGDQNKAFDAVQEAANKALKDGALTPNSKGILPSGDAGNIIEVAGQQIRLIGGRIKDGVVDLSSFSQKGLK